MNDTVGIDYLDGEASHQGTFEIGDIGGQGKGHGLAQLQARHHIEQRRQNVASHRVRAVKCHAGTAHGWAQITDFLIQTLLPSNELFAGGG